jgi:hypothetical protein
MTLLEQALAERLAAFDEAERAIGARTVRARLERISHEPHRGFEGSFCKPGILGV